MKIFAKKSLRNMRKMSGVPADRIALKARISRVQLWRVESGKETVSFETARRLCKFYERPFIQLFEIVEGKE